MAKEENRKKDNGGLFIPAGALLGLGFGVLYNNIPAGLFIGIGAGFLAWAMIRLLRK